MIWNVLKDYYQKRVIRFFEKNRSAKIFTLLGFTLAFAFLITIVYQSFYYGFKYISYDEFFGTAVTLYVIELFLLVSFLLVLISALLSGIFALFYRSGNASNDDLLMASPNFRQKLPLALLRITLSSLWPLLVIILPALFALQHVFGFPLLGFALALLGVVMLIIFANMLAVVLLLLLAYLHLRIGLFSIKRIIAMAALLFSFFLIFVWSRFASVDLVNFFQARLLSSDASDLSPIFAQFHFFPSHVAALVIHHGQLGQLGTAMLFLACFGVLLAVLTAGYVVFKRGYLIFWQKSQEGSRHSGERALHNIIFKNLMSRALTPTQAIIRKEALTFVRNSRGMWWFAFILFIWGIQAFSAHLLVRGLGEERVAIEGIPGIVGMLQFGVMLYFVSLFVLRFAFPSFSAERKTSWIVGSSPTDMKAVFASKLAFFVTFFSVFAVLFTLVSAREVGLALPLGVPMVFAAILCTFTLTTYGLALGVMFPSKETDDPERLTTTLPGLAFIFGALFYGALSAYALQQYFIADDLSFFVGFCMLSFMSVLWLVRVARRSLAQTSTAFL